MVPGGFPRAARQPGGTEFYGAVPKHSATFAWSELCATADPEASLAPVPQVPMKSWCPSSGRGPTSSYTAAYIGSFPILAKRRMGCMSFVSAYAA